MGTGLAERHRRRRRCCGWTRWCPRQALPSASDARRLAARLNQPPRPRDPPLSDSCASVAATAPEGEEPHAARVGPGGERELRTPSRVREGPPPRARSGRERRRCGRRRRGGTEKPASPAPRTLHLGTAQGSLTRVEGPQRDAPSAHDPQT